MSRHSMRNVFLLFAAALFLFSAQRIFAEDVTIAYPNKDHAVFTVTAPDSWEMEPAKEDGDYFTLTGPTDAVLSFRAIPGTKDDLEDAIKDGVQYIKDNYDDVKMGEAKEMDGIDGFSASGTGKYKDDGSACMIEMKWFALRSGKIGEIWYEAGADDKEGMDQANAILSTFKGL